MSEAKRLYFVVLIDQILKLGNLGRRGTRRFLLGSWCIRSQVDGKL